MFRSIKIMEQVGENLPEGSTSVEQEEESSSTEEEYEHILDKGEEDFDDFSADDLRRIPELGYSNAQVQEEVSKMSPAERTRFEELRRHYRHQYRLQGLIVPLNEIIKEALDERYPGLPGSQSTAVLEERDRLQRQLQNAEDTEVGEGGEPSSGVDLTKVKREFKPDVDISHLSLYPAKTIMDTIDLTRDPDQNLYIKVESNEMFHDVLTCKGDGFDDLFTTDKTGEIEEISIHSSDDEDPFTGEIASKLL